MGKYTIREFIMKRMVIPLLFVGILVIALGAVAYVVVQTLKPPISYDELTRLQDEGEKAAPEIPRVVACLDVNDEALRAQAAETLSKIGPKSVDAVRAKLASGNPKTRYWAVLTLALLGPQAAAATNDLLPLLKDGDAAVRYKTVYALGKLDVRSA